MNNKFIRSSDGQWHNLSHIRSFYVGGDKSVGFRICFSYEFKDQKNKYMICDFMAFGDSFIKKEECQKVLDDFIQKLTSNLGQNETK